MSKNKFLAILCALCCLFSLSSLVYAEPGDDGAGGGTFAYQSGCEKSGSDADNYVTMLLSNSVIPDSAKGDENTSLTFTPSELPANGFIEGAVYQIKQIKGAYDPATGTYADAKTGNIEVKMDFTNPTVTNNSAGFTVKKVEPINAASLPDGNTMYAPLAGKGLAISLERGTYTITEVTPAPGYNTYDVRRWDKNAQTTAGTPASPDGTGDKPAITLELPRTTAAGLCEALLNWVNFKGEDTRVDITITKKDGDNNNAILPGATFGIYEETEDAHQDGFVTYEGKEYKPYVIGSDNKVKTGDDGIATFKNIPAGKYLVKELAVPTSTNPETVYLLNPAVYLFTVESNDYSEMKVTVAGSNEEEFKFKKDVLDFTQVVPKKGVNHLDESGAEKDTVRPASGPQDLAMEYFNRLETFEYTLDTVLPNDIKDYVKFKISDVNQDPGKVDFGAPKTVIYYTKEEVAQLKIYEDAVHAKTTPLPEKPAGKVLYTSAIADPFEALKADWNLDIKSGEQVIFNQKWDNATHTLSLEKPAKTDESQAAWAATLPSGGMLRVVVPARLTKDAVVKDVGHLNKFKVEYTPAGGAADGEKESNNTKVSPKDSHLMVTKKNSDETANLEGAEFTLTPVSGVAASDLNKAGNTRSFTVCSSTDIKAVAEGGKEECQGLQAGQYKLTNLDFGTYALKETKAPEGYRLPDQAITVTLTEGNDPSSVVAVDINVKNFKSDEFLPQTGSRLTVFYAAAGLLCLAVAVLMGKKAKKKNTSEM